MKKKYIDAEILKAEIQRRYNKLQKEYRRTAFPYYDGGMDALDLFEQFIDSLQKEQPEVDLKNEYNEYVDADPVLSKLVNHYAGMSIARHFYGLGLNARKEEKI